MLSFEEKKAIFDSYPELTATPVSMNRVNYHLKEVLLLKRWLYVSYTQMAMP